MKRITSMVAGGARLARELRGDGLFDVSDEQLELLICACENHTDVTYCDLPL
jgi:hypothetical protein